MYRFRYFKKCEGREHVYSMNNSKMDKPLDDITTPLNLYAYGEANIGPHALRDPNAKFPKSHLVGKSKKSRGARAAAQANGEAARRYYSRPPYPIFYFTFTAG